MTAAAKSASVADAIREAIIELAPDALRNRSAQQIAAGRVHAGEALRAALPRAEALEALAATCDQWMDEALAPIMPDREVVKEIRAALRRVREAS